MSTPQILEPEVSDSAPLRPTPDRGHAEQIATVPVSTFQITLHQFWRSDPLEAAGESLSNFNFAASYPVSLRERDQLITRLYGTAYARLKDGSIPGTTLKVIDYKDAQIGREPPRRYLLVEVESLRRTHMSLYASFLPYGDHLYVALHSYILPPLSVWRLLRAAVIGAWLFLMINAFLPFLGFFVAIGVLLWYFRGVVSSLSQGDPLDLALRRQFNKAHNLGTFNQDDVLMFFKSAVPLVLQSTQEVFREHDIPVDVLEAAIQNVNYVTNVNTGGGMFNSINSILGGTGNRVSATQRK